MLMKTKITSTVIILATLMLLFSCNQNQVKNQSMASVIGGAGELLVVIDKADWQSKLGDTIRYFLAGQIPMVTQEEPYFDLSQVMETNFSGVFKYHRNILIVKVKPDAKPLFTVREDVYASPQIIGYLVAPSVESMINLITSQGEAVRSKFVLKEVDRWIKVDQKTFNKKITDDIKKQQNYWLLVPRGYQLAVNKKNFIWLSSESSDYNLGVIGWDYPFTSKEQLTPENLIKKRNEVLKANLPGPVENSYMKTEEILAPVTAEFMYKGRYFLQMDGLWKLENAFMGGPFVSFTTIDDQRKRIITVEGFVFAPRKEKRNFLRQLQGILYTLDVVKEEKK
jgi:hypothetical protein